MKKTYIVTLLLCLASLATIAQTPSDAVMADKITNLILRKQAIAKINEDAHEALRLVIGNDDIYSVHYNSKTRQVSMYLYNGDRYSIKGEYYSLTPQQNSKLLAIYLKTFKAYQIASNRKKQIVASQLDKL